MFRICPDAADVTKTWRKKKFIFGIKTEKIFRKFSKKFFRNFYDYNHDMCLLLQS